ncbi:MAG TPA: hypothetical protein PLJ78_12895 [Anaerolineae bacterium]|nr:hypothetical protein [Anaerolineae bacterium]HQK14827.1 hypothetical protein [Anaerolineae bacterium]
MPLRKAVREKAFNMARRDLALFLEEHEDDLLAVFREEMQRLDDELPEEAAFIDLNMVGIGDMILKATLRALRRFLREVPENPQHSTEVQPVESVPFWRRKS